MYGWQLMCCSFCQFLVVRWYECPDDSCCVAASVSSWRQWCGVVRVYRWQLLKLLSVPKVCGVRWYECTDDSSWVAPSVSSWRLWCDMNVQVTAVELQLSVSSWRLWCDMSVQVTAIVLQLLSVPEDGGVQEPRAGPARWCARNLQPGAQLPQAAAATLHCHCWGLYSLVSLWFSGCHPDQMLLMCCLK